MSLASIFNSARTGLSVKQNAIDAIANNVANAHSPGYTRKSAQQESVLQNGRVRGVRDLGTARQMDSVLQRELRVHNARNENAATVATYRNHLVQLFGSPGTKTALDTMFNSFTSSLQALSTSPESQSARAEVLARADALAGAVNSISDRIQDLRLNADQQIAEEVDNLNQLVGELHEVNADIKSLGGSSPPPDLLDRRDLLVDKINEIVAVKVRTGASGEVALATSGGTVILDVEPVQFGFSPAHGMTPFHRYEPENPDSRLSGVTLNIGDAAQQDLVSSGSLRSGRLGALFQLRDHDLIEASAQLDGMAAAIAQSLGDQTTAADSVTVGSLTGRRLDISSATSGDRINIEYTENGVSKTITLVKADDAAQLNALESDGGNSRHRVFGFTDGVNLADLVTTLNTELGGAITASDAGGLLQLLPTAGNELRTMQLHHTPLTHQDNGPGLALFTDSAGRPFLDQPGDPPEVRGFAARIMVNTDIRSDPALLVKFDSTKTGDGDPARPIELKKRLVAAEYLVSGETGLRPNQAPATFSPTSLVQRIIAFQGSATRSANGIRDRQAATTEGLAERFRSKVGVDFDTELVQLSMMKQSHQASLRVLEAVRAMFDSLLQKL